MPMVESCYLMPQFEDCTVRRGASLDLTLSSGFGYGLTPISHTLVRIAGGVEKIHTGHDIQVKSFYGVISIIPAIHQSAMAHLPEHRPM